MKKTTKTTDAIQKWMDGMNSGILRPNVNKLYSPENRFNEMLTLGHPVLSHYDKHVLSMTREKLDSKSDIAAELGWRDWQIEQLNERIKELESQKHINEIKAHGIQEALKYIDENSKIVTGDVNAYSLLSYAKKLLTCA
ncbi:hypothetical protein [Gilliamella sp. BG7]|uniref:hypothetical protein n=1 Tax=unclassified Gilliamella TaxID=2685620 RepID=UPI00398821A1